MGVVAVCGTWNFHRFGAKRVMRAGLFIAASSELPWDMLGEDHQMMVPVGDVAVKAAGDNGVFA